MPLILLLHKLLVSITDGAARFNLARPLLRQREFLWSVAHALSLRMVLFIAHLVTTAVRAHDQLVRALKLTIFAQVLS